VRATGRVAIGTLVAILGMQAAFAADDNAPSATTSPAVNAVEVRIGAVLASNSGNEFDARLTSLQRQFDTLFRYTSYHLVKEERQRVAWGGKVAFDIPGGRYLLVVPREFKNERISMRVMLIEGSRPVVDTAVSLRNHAIFLVGGPQQREGVLILSIGADTLP
jgi:hypothetical protein